MRLLLLLLACACDPTLNMSERLEKRIIDECPEALDRLRHCCPQYESYLSCTVFEKWSGQQSADLTQKESHCLRYSDCGAIEKAITSGKKVCGVEFRGHLCH